MTIGSAWNVDNPEKPWALFDPEARIAIPIGLIDWLASIGATYGSHQVIAAAPLECADEGTNEDGTILVQMQLAAAAEFAQGMKYPFTVRVMGDDGFTTDDRTFWLKVKDR